MTPSPEVVTYSPSITLALTRACVDHCGYCAFRSETDGLWPLHRASETIARAKELGCTELLVMTGQSPEAYPHVRRDLEGMGFESFVAYVCAVCRMGLEAGLLPHTNIGCLPEEDLLRLRNCNVSMGLMLESIADGLPAHGASPHKDPTARLRHIELAGELRIPFTTGVLIGVGESAEERRQSLLALKEIHDRHGHLQEIILQNFVPHPGTPMATVQPPTKGDLLATVRLARELLPDVPIQVPPNLNLDVVPFVEAGVRDLGGISPEQDWVNPQQPWPPLEQLRLALAEAGYELRPRLPVYPRFASPEWQSPAVWPYVSFHLR